MEVVCEVTGYARSQGKTLVSFDPTDLICCRNGNSHEIEVSGNGTVNATDWKKNSNGADKPEKSDKSSSEVTMTHDAEQEASSTTIRLF